MLRSGNPDSGPEQPVTSVDEFVEHNVLPEFHDVVALLRDLMRADAPDASEKVGYGMPMWVGRWPLAWITATQKGITLGFRAGAYFDDPFGLLKGKGKHARNVKIGSLEEANREALRHYIRQAVEHDTNLEEQ